MADEYPLRLEVDDTDSGVIISYEDPSPEAGSILQQVHRRGRLVDEQILSKESYSIAGLRRQWEAQVDDCQNERPPFSHEDIPVEPDSMEMAQAILGISQELEALVGRLEAFLDVEYHPDLSEARYDLRKACEFSMCAAHRTKELANA